VAEAAIGEGDCHFGAAGLSEAISVLTISAGPSFAGGVSTQKGRRHSRSPQDELSSDVVGLDVYNKDKQNIGTIKDIARVKRTEVSVNHEKPQPGKIGTKLWAKFDRR
jgi:hypothetical protein